MFVLDTNTVIYFFKDMGRVKHNFSLHQPDHIFIPTPVIFELKVGILKTGSSKKGQQLNHLIRACSVLGLGYPEAAAASKIRVELEQKGTPIGPIDNLIAGCALASSMTLVTHNSREFSRINGLALEDWF